MRLMLVTLILAGCSALAPAQLDPQAGKVTFGRSLDTTTFVLTGEATSFAVNSDVAYRGALSRVLTGGSIRLHGTLNDFVVLDQSNAVQEEGFTLYGGTLPGALLFEPGTFRLRLLDFGNSELATGTFTITP